MTNSYGEKQKWNEEMYSRFPTKRTYEHKNFLVRFIEEKRVNNVLKFSEIKNEDRVIEIGCEAGYLLKRLLIAREIVGLDIARNALLDAHKNVNADKVKFVCADASHVPFENNYFDKVICSQTLEHLNNPKEVISEMYRIVKQQGVVVISVPNEKILSILKKFFIKIGLFNLFFRGIEPTSSSWHIQSFSKKDIYELLGKYFKIQRFKYTPIPFFGPEMVMKCIPIPKSKYENNVN